MVYTVRQRKVKKSSTNQIILYEKALGDAGKEKKKKKKNNFSNMEKPLAETGPGSGNHLLQPGPFGGEAMLLSWKRVAYPTLPWLLTMWALTSLSRGWISLQHSSQ